jgi:hypothetical protein
MTEMDIMEMGGNEPMKSKLFKMLPAAIILVLCVGAGIGFTQQETPQQIVNRASQAYNHKWKADHIKDYVGTGKITITGNPNSPLDFTLIVKQKDKVKLTVMAPDGSTVLISKGSDGKKNWHKAGLFSGDATGAVAHFIDGHTIRTIARLFDDDNVLSDKGPADPNHAPESASSRVIEAKYKKGLSARYYIDNTTSLITRIEFETGATYSLLLDNKKYPVMAAFVFSDYRQVNGIPTPFKIGVYEGLTKVEELNFTSVQYNTGVKDKDFDR